MKTRIKSASFSILAVALLACAAAQTGCRSTPTAADQRLVTIELTGTPGAIVTLQYIAAGKRLQSDCTLPVTIRQTGILKVLAAKTDPDDEMQLLVNGNGGDIGPGDSSSIFCELEPWPHSRAVPAGMALLPPLETKVVLRPYRVGDAWVVDDPQLELVGAPLVNAGQPPQANPEDNYRLMDFMLKDIPNARAGFKLTLCRHPFRGWQTKLTCVGETDGFWNIYSISTTAAQGQALQIKGWFSPLIYRYFSLTPSELYIRVERN